MENLSDNAYNITSQAGEDGIIEEIMKRLGIEKGNFSEFGSLDGIQFSNSKQLVDKGWSGLYIEANPAYYKCVENYKDNDKITVVRGSRWQLQATRLRVAREVSGQPPGWQLCLLAQKRATLRIQRGSPDTPAAP